MLGWEPKVDLHSGLVATCAWFAEELQDREQPRESAPELVCAAE
jgi:dTDP-D-glucose 4,6-dehydratase